MSVGCADASDSGNTCSCCQSPGSVTLLMSPRSSSTQKSKDWKTLFYHFLLRRDSSNKEQISFPYTLSAHHQCGPGLDHSVIAVGCGAENGSEVEAFGLCVASFFRDPSCRNLEGGPRHRGCPPLMATVTASQERVILSWRDEIPNEMKSMLSEVGSKMDFIEKSAPVLPVSVCMGDTLLKKPDSMRWWKGVNASMVTTEFHVDSLYDVLDKSTGAFP